MTQMQMVQFCVMIVQGALNIMYDCPYPYAVSVFYVVYIAFMLALFASFYINKHFAKRAAAAKLNKSA